MKRTIPVWLITLAAVVLMVAGSTWFTRVRRLPTAVLDRTVAQTAVLAPATTDPKGGSQTYQ